jgi:hypothetical protein
MGGKLREVRERADPSVAGLGMRPKLLKEYFRSRADGDIQRAHLCTKAAARHFGWAKLIRQAGRFAVVELWA